jgi:sugar phosphate isomerase/epimerase
MRLGGPVFVKDNEPENFVLAHVKKGYGAALCPEGLKAGMSDEIRQYREAFKKHDVVLAEVGVWNNPLSRDREAAKEAFDYAV